MDGLGLSADTGTTAYVHDTAPGLPLGRPGTERRGYFVLIVTGTERTAETLPATSVTRYDTV